MHSGTVARILEKVRDCWSCANDIEVTLEANPTSVEAARFAGYRDAGVNRISIGVQSLVADDLRKLGRLHSVEEALSALEIAQGAFDRVSFDLIYARQSQSLEDWQNELKQCLSLRPDHLSLYQLTIEDGTAFGALHQRGKLIGLPDDDLSADMYNLTQSMTTEAGLPAYEVSNHARLGQEARHNLIYWNCGDWIGIGPGAHGRLTHGNQRYGTVSPSAPGAWLSKSKEGGAVSIEGISGTESATEYLLMSLRTKYGCSLKHLTALDNEVSKYVVKRLDVGDLPLNVDDGVLTVKSDGRLILNEVLVQLLRDSA